MPPSREEHSSQPLPPKPLPSLVPLHRPQLNRRPAQLLRPPRHQLPSFTAFTGVTGLREGKQGAHATQLSRAGANKAT